MISRRGFLGSLIGMCSALIVAPTIILPESQFIAQAETAEWQRTALPWRILIDDARKGRFQGPAVTRVVEGDEGLLSFECEPIIATQLDTYDIDRFILMNERSQHSMAFHPKHHQYILCKGDTLSFALHTRDSHLLK